MPPARRMEDHIRNLCQKLVEADDTSDEFAFIAAELRASLSEHIKQIRQRLKGYPLAKERRSGTINTNVSGHYERTY
jgi:hypothetical protein